MFGKKIRVALLTGALAAACALPALAQEEKKDDKTKEEPKEKIEAPKEEAKPAHPAPALCKVLVNEWVSEAYPCTRTVYRTECRTETYTAHRTECVPQTVVRNVCVSVPCVEQRTVMQPHYTCKPVTEVVRKCVDKGHYECREVPCEPSCFDRMRKWWKGRKCDDCCEPCCEPVRTKTVKVWVPCPVWEEHCVTKMVRSCEYRPVVVNVTVCKKEMRQETCTVMVSRCVPYQATRTVQVCVPHTETVTATRMVCRTVEKLVPAADCCAPSCCEPCCTPCCNSHSRKCCR